MITVHWTFFSVESHKGWNLQSATRLRWLMFLPAGWCRAELWCHLLSNKAFNQVWLVGSWNDFSCELTNGIMEGISCNESNDPKKRRMVPFFHDWCQNVSDPLPAHCAGHCGLLHQRVAAHVSQGLAGWMNDQSMVIRKCHILWRISDGSKLCP